MTSTDARRPPLPDIGRGAVAAAVAADPAVATAAVRADNAGEETGARRGARLIGIALVLLVILGLGLLAVSYAAQYRFIAGQRHQQEVASAIEAGCLDVGLCILSLLALGLARRGVSSVVERALVVIVALWSAGMNYAAADVSSPRSIVAYCMPPVFLAIVADRTVATVRRHILGMREGRSPWAALGRAVMLAVLYVLRFAAAPVSTLLGLRRALLDATPLPGRTAVPPGPPGPGQSSATVPPRGVPGPLQGPGLARVPAGLGLAGAPAVGYEPAAGNGWPGRAEPVARALGDPARATVPSPARASAPAAREAGPGRDEGAARASVPPEPPDRATAPGPGTVPPVARGPGRAGGMDTARAAYAASVAEGVPLSARALAAEHGISRRQAAKIAGSTS